MSWANPTSHWANGYVGLPFAELGRDRSGCDCWGLACLVYAECLGIALPDYLGGYASTAERAEIAALISAAEATGPWRPVADIRPFDILLFRRGQQPAHVGIAIGRGRMLHMDSQLQARVALLDATRFRSRFKGAFRHVEAGLKGVSCPLQ